LLLKVAKNVNDDRLTKEELQYLIEQLSLSDDEPVNTPLESSAVPGTPQLDRKKRLHCRRTSLQVSAIGVEDVLFT
jgi:hypothetical protein